MDLTCLITAVWCKDAYWRKTRDSNPHASFLTPAFEAGTIAVLPVFLNWWRATESNKCVALAKRIPRSAGASGLQPDGFAASLTLRKGAPGIRPDVLPIPRREGQSRSSLVCWYCLRCQANRFYGPARSRRQRRPFDPWMGNLVDLDGVEPTTFRLQGGCSTN